MITFNNKEFVWDPTAGESTKPLVFFNRTRSTILYYAHDANKNVIELVYNAISNNIGAHYEYDTFGNTIATSRNVASTPNIITENPFRFSSEYHDDELALIFYNYRHYNPQSGRWISRDPIEKQGGNNLYGMCKNNCIDINDIKGLLSSSLKNYKREDFAFFHIRFSMGIGGSFSVNGKKESGDHCCKTGPHKGQCKTIIESVITARLAAEAGIAGKLEVWGIPLIDYSFIGPSIAVEYPYLNLYDECDGTKQTSHRIQFSINTTIDELSLGLLGGEVLGKGTARFNFYGGFNTNNENSTLNIGIDFFYDIVGRVKFYDKEKAFYETQTINLVNGGWSI